MPLPIPTQDRDVSRERRAEAPAPPAPGVIDTLRDSFTAARADTTGYAKSVQNDAYNPLIEQLDELGYPVTRYVNASRGGSSYAYDRILADVRREQARGHFKGVDTERESFERAAMEREGRRVDAAAERASRGNPAVAFAGGVGGAMTDPIALYTLPFGGFGKTVLQRVGTEIVANAAIETVLQPTIAQQRKELGREDLTLGEATTNIAFAGVASGAFRGGIELAPRGVSAVRGGLERAVDAGWDRLPKGLQERWAQRATIEGQPAADILRSDVIEALAGRDNMSVLEGDAVDVIRREAQFAQANPFVPDGAGGAMHDALASEALRRILAGNPLPAVPPSARNLASVAERPAALPRGLGRTRAPAADAPGAIGSFMAKTRRAESGGNDAARNPRSSATGRYQFTDSTWLAYYRRRFGSGESRAAILAKRSDGALQDTLMRDLTEDNARFLRGEGEAVTEGNLYLVHFAGQGGARKVFGAAEDAPIERVWSADVIKANPFLRGKTAGEVIRWAHGKMGGAPVAVRATARVSDAIGRNEAERAAIQDALDAAQERATQAAQAQREARERPDFIAEDDLPEPVQVDGEDFAPVTAEPARRVETPADAFDMDAPPEAVTALLPRLGAFAEDRARSLNRIEELAEELGAEPGDVRRGLTLLAARGDITMNRKTGNFMRKPPRADSEELLEFIARAGGIRDDEGHALGLRGLSEREKRELTPAARRDLQRKRRSGRRDWGRMTRSNGPLLRHEGLSIDAVGEALWGAGWFTERPTVRQVLELIDNRMASGKPAYPPGHIAGETANTPATRGPEPGDEEWEFYSAEVRGHLVDWMGFAEDELNPAMLDELVDFYVNSSASTMEEALFDGVNMMMARNQAEAIANDPGGAYDFIDYEPPLSARSPLGGEDIPTAEDIAGWERTREDPRAGGVRGEDSGADAAADGRALSAQPEAERTAFLDPEGSTPRAQADSLLHDARMTIDPDIARRQREEARLRAEAPLRGENATGEAQDGTMGMPLFDEADQPTFRLDEEGEPQDMRSLIDDIEAEETDLKNIRDCL